jgi:hypothetical protein
LPFIGLTATALFCFELRIGTSVMGALIGRGEMIKRANEPGTSCRKCSNLEQHVHTIRDWDGSLYGYCAPFCRRRASLEIPDREAVKGCPAWESIDD